MPYTTQGCPNIDRCTQLLVTSSLSDTNSPFGAHYTDFGQHGDRWRALVNVVTKPSVSLKAVNFHDQLSNCSLLKITTLLK
jgi:hypothetical protein